MRSLLSAVCVLGFAMPARASVQNARTTASYPTISAAVADALSGDTLLIGPGTYAEHVLVDRSLTLRGTGAAPGPSRVSITWSDPAFSSDILTVTAGVELHLSGVYLTSTGNVRGLYASFATLVELKDVIVEGTSGSSGGGLYLDNSTVELRDVLVSGTSASADGGGILALNVDLTCDACTITGSSTFGDGGAIASVGGSLELRGSRLLGNSAASSGGAIRGQWSGGALSIRNTLIHGNSALLGGGIHAMGGTIEATQVVLTHNSGGAIATQLSDQVLLERVLVCGNAATGSVATLDGAIVMVHNGAFVDNSGLSALELVTDGSVSNSTFLANQVAEAALDASGAVSGGAIRNNAFLGTSGGAGVAAGVGTPPTSYNAYYANSSGPIAGDTPGPADLVGVPPMLGSYTHNGNCFDDDPSLRPGSPLRDAGDPGLFDPDGTRSDIGVLGGPHARLGP